MACEYFVWVIYPRDGVWQADGRSNNPNAGRHSLGTRDENEAIKILKALDLRSAVHHRLADATILNRDRADELSLERGKQMYLEYVKRPSIRGGVRPKTVARYRTVLDKAIPIFQKQLVRSWNQLKPIHLDGYAAWLDGEQYLPRTQYFALTCIKTVLKYLIAEKLIPAECAFKMKLRKPKGTDTYCWLRAQVEAMVRYCEQDPNLTWLKHVIIGLARTGMRISEMAGLRWPDVDLERDFISLKDESSGKRHAAHDMRTTKNKQSRSFPIHPDLKGVLELLHRRGDVSGSVFTGPGGAPLRPDTVRVALINSVLKPLETMFPSGEDEIGFKDGRLHSFRHFFCSECSNDGVPEQTVMLWLGHQSSAMVRHYFHLHDPEAQMQMKKVSSILKPGAT